MTSLHFFMETKGSENLLWRSESMVFKKEMYIVKEKCELAKSNNASRDFSMVIVDTNPIACKAPKHIDMIKYTEIGASALVVNISGDIVIGYNLARRYDVQQESTRRRCEKERVKTSILEKDKIKQNLNL